MKDIKGCCSISVSLNEVNENTVINIASTSKELFNNEMDNTAIFEIDEDGKIVFNVTTIENSNEKAIYSIKETNSLEKSNKIYVNSNNQNLIYVFEKVPENISEEQIIEIVEYLNEKAVEQSGSRIYPYKAELMKNGDLMITLVIYNGDELVLDLKQLPLKVTDADKLVVTADLVEVNAVVSPGKTGVFQSIISREKLRNKSPNMENYTLVFGI